MSRPDLDNPTQIDAFVDRFYSRVLEDPLLAPVFLERAAIDLGEHLPRIKAYWRKMLLGDDVYHRHMMRKHRELDSREPFVQEHYERWLSLFEETLQNHHVGPLADRALALARRVAVNMRRNLERFRA
ncbi:MAG: group III truncated hemoglobin [Congregibacter sp.]